MKALTLWRPWPWAIFHAQQNPKRIENRPWSPPPYVTDRVIAIHAGAFFDKSAVWPIVERAAFFGVLDPADQALMHRQGIVGVARVSGWFETAGAAEKWLPGQGEWFSGPCGWKLTDVRALARPVPCKGFQKLWNLPPEVERQVLAQL